MSCSIFYSTKNTLRCFITWDTPAGWHSRDPPPKNFLSPKSHILDSNGVWYSSFWSEGLKNHLNLEDLVSRFAPRDFEAKWTWDFEARWKKQDGNRWDLKGCQRDLKGRQEMIKHWGVLSLLLRLEFPCCGPSNPILLCLKILGLPRLESPRDKFWVNFFQV